MSNSPYGMFFQPLDLNGNPYPGAKMYCVAAGGTYPANAQVVYSNYLCTTPLVNPVVADANGVFPTHYLANGTGYKFIIKDSADAVTLRTDDNVYGARSESGSVVAGTSSSGTAAVTGTNSSTGDGVHGKSTGTGYGVRAEADTTTPVSAALHIVPQDTTPSTPAKGNVWINSVTGKMSTHDGTSEHRSVGSLYASTASEAQACPATFGTKKTLGANTLRVGSTLRIKAYLKCTASTAGNGVTLTTTLRLGGVTVGAIVFTENTGVPLHVIANDVAIFDATIVIASVGAGGTFNAICNKLCTAQTTGTTYDQDMAIVEAGAIDTTAANDIDITIAISANTGSMTLYMLAVDIA